MKKPFLLPFIAILLILTPQVSFAEDLSARTIQQRIDASVSPQYPGPNETVTIKLQNYSEDVSSIRFNWSLDGVSKLSGPGENIFSFTTGPDGSRHRIYVSLNGSLVSTSKTFDFGIGSVDLIPEPFSYTHPFYEGKSFPSYDSDVSVVAIPNISGVSRDNLHYTWKQDGVVLGSVSGVGRSSLLVPSSYLIKTKNIEVLVGESANSVVAKGNVSITPQEGQVLIYEDSPLYGVLYNQAIRELNLPEKELSIVAEPYFFSSVGSYPILEFVWKMNNSLISNPGNTLTLRNEDNSTGTSEVSVEAKNSLSILESARTSSLLNF